MDTKHVLGVIGIAVILVAVGFAIGLSVGDDDGKDAGDGGSSGSETSNRVEYRLELQNNVSIYSIDVYISAPVGGYYQLYIGDEPLRNDEGEILGESWTGARTIHGMWWAPYEPGQSFEDVEQQLNVRFSSNLDPVRVY